MMSSLGGGPEMGVPGGIGGMGPETNLNQALMDLLIRVGGGKEQGAGGYLGYEYLQLFGREEASRVGGMDRIVTQSVWGPHFEVLELGVTAEKLPQSIAAVESSLMATRGATRQDQFPLMLRFGPDVLDKGFDVTMMAAETLWEEVKAMIMLSTHQSWEFGLDDVSKIYKALASGQHPPWMSAKEMGAIWQKRSVPTHFTRKEGEKVIDEEMMKNPEERSKLLLAQVYSGEEIESMQKEKGENFLLQEAGELEKIRMGLMANRALRLWEMAGRGELDDQKGENPLLPPNPFAKMLFQSDFEQLGLHIAKKVGAEFGYKEEFLDDKYSAAMADCRWATWVALAFHNLYGFDAKAVKNIDPDTGAVALDIIMSEDTKLFNPAARMTLEKNKGRWTGLRYANRLLPGMMRSLPEMISVKIGGTKGEKRWEGVTLSLDELWRPNKELGWPGLPMAFAGFGVRSPKFMHERVIQYLRLVQRNPKCIDSYRRGILTAEGDVKVDPVTGITDQIQLFQYLEANYAGKVFEAFFADTETVSKLLNMVISPDLRRFSLSLNSLVKPLTSMIGMSFPTLSGELSKKVQRCTAAVYLGAIGAAATGPGVIESLENMMENVVQNKDVDKTPENLSFPQRVVANTPRKGLLAVIAAAAAESRGEDPEAGRKGKGATKIFGESDIKDEQMVGVRIEMAVARLADELYSTGVQGLIFPPDTEDKLEGERLRDIIEKMIRERGNFSPFELEYFTEDEREILRGVGVYDESVQRMEDKRRNRK